MAPPAPRACAQTALPPDFVLILAGGPGWGGLGCYGSPGIRTPRLDRMAREGVRFTDFSRSRCAGRRGRR